MKHSLLCLFPAGYTSVFAEARLAGFGPGPGLGEAMRQANEAATQQAETLITDPNKIAEIKDEEARKEIKDAVDMYQANVEHDGEGNAGVARETAVRDIRSALQKAAERARQTTEQGQKETTDTNENPNAVKIDRTNPEYATTTSSEGTYTWPKEFNDQQLTALHNVRKGMVDKPGQFKPTPEGQAINGVRVIDQQQTDNVLTLDAKGQQVVWRRDGDLTAQDYVKLHEAIHNPSAANTEQQQNQAKEVAQKQAKQKIEGQNGRLDTGRESPELRELAKAIAELIKAIIEKIKGPNAAPNGPGNQPAAKVAAEGAAKTSEAVNKGVAEDLAKLRDKPNTSTDMTDKERTQLREGYEKEKASNSEALKKIGDEMPKVAQEETDLKTSIEDQKKEIKTMEDKDKENPDLVRMKSKLEKTEKTLKEVTDHKTRLETQKKKLEDRNKVLDDKLKAIEKPKTVTEILKDLQDKLKALADKAEITVDIEAKPLPKITIKAVTNAQKIAMTEMIAKEIPDYEKAVSLNFEGVTDAK